MKSRIFVSMLISLFIALTGCKVKKDKATVDYTLEYSLESVVTSLGDVADDENNEEFAQYSPESNFLDQLQNMIIPKAYATSCVRAVASPCENGNKAASYNGCYLPQTKVTVNGEVNLEYTTQDCTLANSGDAVNRTYEIEFQGPRGGTLQVFSDANDGSNIDYEGNEILGGGLLTNTDAGWDIEILGKNKELYGPGGLKWFDHSIYTTSPLHVTGTLGRANRNIDGGAVVVAHNIAKFKATYQPSNVQWSSSCCHPISGSINITYEGSITGSASVEFNSCGSANFYRNGELKKYLFSYCE